MGKNLESQNDKLIEELIEDPLFKIQRNGKIFSKITENGQGESEEWREVGYKKADGYIRFRYKNEFLFVHRVIYRKYKGKLDKNKIINHIKPNSNSNNSIDNLEQISQADNNQDRWDKVAFVKKVISKLRDR